MLSVLCYELRGRRTWAGFDCRVELQAPAVALRLTEELSAMHIVASATRIVARLAMRGATSSMHQLRAHSADLANFGLVLRFLNRGSAQYGARC